MNVKELVSQKEYFLFDLDGTIVDLEKLNYFSFQKAIKDLLNLDLKQDEYKKFFAGRGSHKGFEAYFAYKQLSDLDIEKFVLYYRDVNWDGIKNHFEDNILLKRGVLDFCKALKGRGSRVAIGTSRNKEFTQYILKRIGLDKYLDAIVTIEDVVNTKPAPDIFFKALSLIEGQKEKALIFEDSLNGVQSAENTGIDYVVIHNKGFNDDVVKQRKYVIEDFTNLI